jgi:Zn-dependent protease with chaperone function
MGGRSPVVAVSEPRASRALATSSLRLVLLVLEGYGYFILIIGVFVAEMALLAWGLLARRPVIAVIAVIFGVPLVATLASAVRSLFFRIRSPDGVPLSRERAPRLHAVVEELRRRVQAPRVHRILVTGICNASALQLPRFGIFWPRNTLSIGYPLLVSLSPEQLQAVIAHELGHLSAAHGRIIRWIYRARVSWMRLVERLSARRAAPVYVYWLSRWYLSRLHAHSAELARAQELLADRCAAAIAGRNPAAAALVILQVGGLLLEEKFWPDVFKGVERDPEPPAPYAQMGPRLRSVMADEDATAYLKRLVEDTSASDDTHPSLSERLRALDAEIHLPGRAEPSAGEAYLSGELPAIAAQLDAAWQAAHAADWRARHTAICKNRHRLAELSARACPTANEIFQRGELLEQLDGWESGLPHYQAALDAGHGGGGLAAGRILLGRGDEAGMELVERAMALDPELEGEGCALLARFHEQRNRLTEAQRFLARARRHRTRTTMAEEERAQVGAFDRFEPNGLSPVDAEKVARKLAAYPSVSRAYLVARHLRYSTGTQLLLGIVTSGPSQGDLAEALRSERLDDDVMIVMLTRRDQSLLAALTAVPGACIHDRNGRPSDGQ